MFKKELYVVYLDNSISRSPYYPGYCIEDSYEDALQSIDSLHKQYKRGGFDVDKSRFTIVKYVPKENMEITE